MHVNKLWRNKNFYYTYLKLSYAIEMHDKLWRNKILYQTYFSISEINYEELSFSIDQARWLYIAMKPYMNDSLER